ncbi:hypothetical protein FHS95_001129 [Sphingomonas naasensis]|uniref:Uncharacterized protein n=1 Tax=Sphingomonas naasensis TaxID=1344951 RepID=A0A4S1WCF6_9SPHN|nr:hypothetical protein [Sphingomonas naasensis]NIJ19460.1 hypothetical protein [Sphingomonas naasensis]TGX39197.1 hypothetical protein E5A74_16910 [Sphingomonas naasensis]
MAIIKFCASIALMVLWGPYLLYVWAVPAAVPEWAYGPGLRRVFMLSSNFEPTVFTLLFGLGFTGIALLGVGAVLSGKAQFQN